jgi:mannose-6-phosphate isomerase-like protein (cupin superfamily)
MNAKATMARPVVSRRHYRFADTSFHRMVAHDGKGEILTSRAEEVSTVGAANFLDLTILPPGTSIGVHTHGPADEEIYVIVSGEGTMRLEDEEFAVVPGDVIVNQRRGTHGLANTGTEPIRLVVVELPALSLDETPCS